MVLYFKSLLLNIYIMSELLSHDYGKVFLQKFHNLLKHSIGAESSLTC